MKKFVLTLVVLALFVSPAFADSFGVFADNQALACNITVAAPTLIKVYVIHKTTGATGSQWKVVAPTSASFQAAGSQVGNAAFLVIGEPYTDVTIAYTSCVTGTVPVWELTFFATAAPPDCSYISVVPAPGKPYAITVTCDFAELPAYEGQGIFSPTASCPCDVATAPSTWGKVKSLYR